MVFGKAAVFAAVASLAVFTRAQDTSWHLNKAYFIANEMLDPIISPNAQSSHEHKILGGSSFGANYNYEQTQTSSCSSVPMQADKSNYWMPNLYWVTDATNPSTTFIPVPAGVRFYYFLGQNSVNDPVQPFPKGLRMVVGDPNLKDTSTSDFYAAWTCQVNQDFSNSIVGSSFNFERDCPYGMRTDLTFPQCWDGINLYKSDNSHMSRPLNGNARDGSCPMSHPVRVPTIMLEYTWAIANVAPCQALKGHMAWANGDTTGAGIHGDFINGWDMDVLGRALNSTDCGIGQNRDILFDSCPEIFATFNLDLAANCSPDRGILQNPMGNTDAVPVSTLPGCNKLWGASGSKPTCDPAVAGLDVSPYTGVDGSLLAAVPQNIALPNTTGWHLLACVGNVANALGASRQQYLDSTMTIESCQKSCQQNNLPYAATGEYGAGNFVCMCSATLDYTQAQMQPGLCSDPCPGNKAEQCGGGNYLFNVYYSSNVTAADLTYNYTSFGAQYLGCLSTNNPSNQMYSFTSGQMTVEICNQACQDRNATWSAVTQGNKCACGTDATVLQAYPYIPDSYCGNTCTGNSTERCGGPAQSSIYNVSQAIYTASITPRVTGWQGCYALKSGAPALTGTTFTSSLMTQSICVTGCSELGYAYAGLTNGNTCACGSTLNVGQQQPSSQCAFGCAGNSTTICGGGANTDIYSTDTWPSVAQVGVNGGYPAPYLGCWVDSGTALTGTNYSYSASGMTIEVCLAACTQFNYPIAALSGGSTCQCGSTAPSTTEVVTSINCKTACPGNSTELCGGAGYRSVFNNTANLAPTVATGNNATTATAYQGCYSNQVVGLPTYTFTLSTMTNDMCRTSCAELGYSLAGTNGGSTCSCGNAWVGGMVLPISSCATPCGGNSTTICGSSSAVSLYSSAGAPAVAARPPGWFGCFSDSASTRALSNWSYTANTMSSSICSTACAQQGYPLAGTASGSICECGTRLTAARLPQVLCSTPCSGDATEFCGGSGRMSAYNTTVTSNPANGGSGTNGTAAGGNSTAVYTTITTGQCYSDGGTLTGLNYASNYMTPTVCATWCKAQGYAYAGVRNGLQCLCGNTSPKLLAPAASCANPCSGDATQNCGTASYTNVISLASLNLPPSGFNMTADSNGYVGCFHEGKTSLLQVSALTSSTLTTLSCVQNCQNLGYALAGAEYGKICYCGNSLNITAIGYEMQNSDCSMPCAGGGTTNCGSAAGVSIYDVAATPGGKWALRQGEKGCFAPGTMISKPDFTYGIGGMTPTMCRQNCQYQGYSYAALTAGQTCMCSNNQLWGAAVAPATCSSVCSGDATQTCGGPSTAVVVFDATTAPALNTTNDYVGCFNDPSATKILNAYTFQSSSMSPGLCENTCTYQGYNVSGVEAGKVCYCGSKMPVAALLPSSLCNSPCVGLTSSMCGGAGKLSLYSAAYAKLYGGVVGTAPTSTLLPSTSTVFANATSTGLTTMTNTSMPLTASSTLASNSSTSFGASATLTSTSLGNTSFTMNSTVSGASGQVTATTTLISAVVNTTSSTFICTSTA